MKTVRSRLGRGFTLVELLIVVAIIAVLAGLSAGVSNMVIRKARIAEAHAAMHGIVSGVEAYRTEYNRYPDVGDPANEIGIDVAETIRILHPAPGDAAAAAKNPHNGMYFTPKLAKDGRGGLTSSGDYVDPWGVSYHLGFDKNNDGQIENPFKGSGEPSFLPLNVIVWSDGPDNKNGNQNTSDDVKSWQ